MDALANAASVGEAANDDLLSCRVSNAMRQSSYPDLRRVHCECHAGVVQLEGQVGSYFLKQMAQATTAGVEGVRRIDNRLRVEAATFVIA